MRTRPYFLCALAALLLAGGSGLAARPAAAAAVDFRVGDILVLSDRFLAVKLENVSAVACPRSPAVLEGVMLIVSINGIRRAEFQGKHLDPLLFRPHGQVLLRTNFRVAGPLLIRAEINPQRAAAETQTANNVLEKTVL
jgi:hypothetical protein